MAVGTAFALPVVVAFASRDRWWHRAVFPVLVVTAVVSIFVLYEVQASAF